MEQRAQYTGMYTVKAECVSLTPHLSVTLNKQHILVVFILFTGGVTSKSWERHNSMLIPSMASWMDSAHCISCRVSGQLILLEKLHCKKVTIFIIPLQTLSHWLKIKHSLHSAKEYNILQRVSACCSPHFLFKSSYIGTWMHPTKPAKSCHHSVVMDHSLHLCLPPCRSNFPLKQESSRGLATHANMCAHTLSFLAHLCIIIETSSVF